MPSPPRERTLRRRRAAGRGGRHLEHEAAPCRGRRRILDPRAPPCSAASSRPRRARFPFRHGGARSAPAPEPLPDALALGVRDPGPLVVDGDLHVAGRVRRASVTVTSGPRAVLHRLSRRLTASAERLGVHRGDDAFAMSPGAHARGTASGANASTTDRISGAIHVGSGATRCACRSEREVQQVSTRCVSRRASWSISRASGGARVAAHAAEEQRLAEHADLRERRRSSCETPTRNRRAAGPDRTPAQLHQRGDDEAAVSSSTPSTYGSASAAAPDDELMAMSGRRVTCTCRPAIIGSTLSRG